MKNRTKITEDNMRFITKCRFNSPLLIFLKIFFIVLGIILLCSGLFWMEEYSNSSKFLNIFLGVFYIILGSPIFFNIILNKNIKLSQIDIEREYIIEDDYILAIKKNEKLENKEKYCYEEMTNAIVKDNCLYIELTKGKYLIMEKSGFEKESDWNKLIKTLETKKIKVKNK